MLSDMVGSTRGRPGRGAVGWPDRMPPPPLTQVAGATCVRCGLVLAPGEQDGGDVPAHLLCDPVERAALLRRLEAARAVHRATHALGAVPAVRARIQEDLAALPDACDVHDALAFLARARTTVECSPELSSQQRRVALSLLDATARKLDA
jgi:hypothetical protein